MYYAYDICLKCQDKLIERDETKENELDFNKQGGECPNCGSTLRLVCTGEKKIDNTLFKIKVTNKGFNDEKSIETIVKICDCDINEANEKLKNEDLEFEGDTYKTYMSMNILDGFDFSYAVDPQFPFSRWAYVICPDCGNVAMEKSEEAEEKEECIKQGWFCETCNEWLTYCYISKMDIDEAIYSIEFSTKDHEVETKEKILELVNKLQKKVIEGNTISVNDKAERIFELLQFIEFKKIQYNINPLFPYKITEYKEVDEAFLNEIIEYHRRNNWFQ